MKLCYACMRHADEKYDRCPFCNENYNNRDFDGNHLLPGTILSKRYIVGRSIGQGGFGITYIGLDTKFKHRKIAIKELYPKGIVSRLNNKEVDMPRSEDDLELYNKLKRKVSAEAQTLAEFDKEQGIVTVHDYFDENNTTYIIMDFVEGKTLKDFLGKEKTLSVDETIDLLLPIMKSLIVVHRASLIHRDISPSNIIVGKDGAVLIDFGAARSFGGDSEETKTVMYKRGYAPMEQYDGHGLQGPWTDVFAMCATIYRCITGKVPSKRVGEGLESPSQLGVAISRGIEDTLMHGLAVEPKDRIQNMEELIEGLTRVYEDEIDDDDKETVLKRDNNSVVDADSSEADSSKKNDSNAEDSYYKFDLGDDLTSKKDLDDIDSSISENFSENDLNDEEKFGYKFDLEDKKHSADKAVKEKRDREKKSIDRKTLIYIGIIVAIVLLIILVGFFIFKIISAPSLSVAPVEPALVVDEEPTKVKSPEGENKESLSDEELFANILISQEKVSANDIISQEVFDAENGKASLIFTGTDSKVSRDNRYDGTLWYVNADKAVKVDSGRFCDTGKYIAANGGGIVVIDYYDSEIEKSLIAAVKDGRLSESNISGMGRLESMVDNCATMYIMSEDSNYDLSENKFVGFSQKPYEFYYDAKSNTFTEYRNTKMTREDVLHKCDTDLYLEIQNRGYNVINAFERRNGIVTINYYGVQDELVEFNQVNWDVNAKKYLLADSNASGDAFEKSGYGGIYLSSINDSFMSSKDYQDVVEQLDNDYTFGKQRIVEGSLVTFGTFEQDCEYSKTEDIIWRVIDIEDNKALLLSEYVLDYEQFNVADVAITWDESTFRQYMNFHLYSYAFTDNDKLKIVPKQRGAEADFVFALELSDVSVSNDEKIYQFPILCEATLYAVKQKGAKVSEDNTCRWWTSTANGKAGQVGAWAYGDEGPYSDTSALLYPTTKSGVRPAIWVKLD